MKSRSLSDAVDIDLRGQPGDVRYECPVCRWGVTLTPEMEAQWTNDRTIQPRCRQDEVALVRSEIEAER